MHDIKRHHCHLQLNVPLKFHWEENS
jgi:hypothetical protein